MLNNSIPINQAQWVEKGTRLGIFLVMGKLKASFFCISHDKILQLNQSTYNIKNKQNINYVQEQ